MLQKFFRPATYVLERLSYSRKLILIALVIVVPLATLTYQLVTALNTDIAATQSEIAGAAYLRPTIALVQHLQQHRGASATFLKGDASFREVMLQKQAAIAADIEAIDAMDAVHGERFGVGASWAELKDTWASLQSDVETLTASESLARHTALIRQVLDYRMSIADASGLTLDPDVDSYYLVVAAVINYPEVTEAIGQARAIGSGALASGTVQMAERVRLESLSLLAASNAATADNGLERALDANATLHDRLLADVSATRDTSLAFQDMLRNQILDIETPTVDAKTYFDTATIVIDRHFALIDTLSTALDELLQARVDRLQSDLLMDLATALLPALVLAYLFVGFYQSVIGSLTAVLSTARKISEVDLPALAAEMGLLAQGDLTRALTIRTEKVKIESRDEFGQLAQAFNTVITRLHESGTAFDAMTQNLRQMIERVARSAEGVQESANHMSEATGQSGQATQQISITMQQVARGSSQQAESITRTASAVEELRRAIDGVAHDAQEQARAVADASHTMSRLAESTSDIRRGALAQIDGTQRAEAAQSHVRESVGAMETATQHAADAAEQSARVADEGSRLAHESTAGMERVRTATEELASRVHDLGKRSGQIGAIVETIDDIAAQTNLLALNAAIEAARAGEHGRGFAVVADEVRKLAERSSDATREIAEMIRLVQSGAGEAVDAMRQAGSEVDATTRATQAAGAAFAEIANETQTLLAQVKAIETAVVAITRSSQALEAAIDESARVAAHNRDASDTMAGLNSEMVSSLDRVSSIVEQNTAATEQMAASSTEVTGSIESIASVSEENSAAVEEVSASTEEVSAQVEELSDNARRLGTMADDLQAVVHQFKLTVDGAAAEAQPARAGCEGTVAVAARQRQRV